MVLYVVVELDFCGFDLVVVLCELYYFFDVYAVDFGDVIWGVVGEHVLF